MTKIICDFQLWILIWQKSKISPVLNNLKFGAIFLLLLDFLNLILKGWNSSRILWAWICYFTGTFEPMLFQPSLG